MSRSESPRLPATAPASLPRRLPSPTRVAVCLLILLAAVLPAAGPAGADPLGATAAPSDRSMLVVGDSVILGAKSAISSEFSDWDLEFDAKVSRSTLAGVDIVASSTASRPVDVLVVALGYNDGGNPTAFARRVDDLLAGAQADLVIWLNLRIDPKNRYDYSGANSVLEQKAASDPRLIVADWSGASQGSGYTWDGLHLTSKGAATMTALIDDTISATADPKSACRPPTNPSAQPDPASGRGYWLLDSNGRVHGYDAPHFGDLVTAGVAAFPRSMQATPSGEGYWIVDENGEVHPFGDASFFGDMSDTVLDGPVQRIEARPDGDGYWLVGSDGGVFSFGRAEFHGSMGGIPLRKPVISMSATVSGDGYWLVGSDGGVFSFGDAVFRGSTGAMVLDAEVIDMAVTPDGGGYWLYAADGGVFSFGVGFHGSIPGLGLCRTPETVAMRVTDTGNGYWLVTDTGWVIPFGDAVDHGGEPGLDPGVRIIDMAVRR